MFLVYMKKFPNTIVGKWGGSLSHIAGGGVLYRFYGGKSGII